MASAVVRRRRAALAEAKPFPVDYATLCASANIVENIGQILYQQRKRRGHSQQAVAMRTGVSITSIHNIELGARSPSAHIVVAILRYCAS